MASADENAAKYYPYKLVKIFQEGRYAPHQIYNADEAALFWKQIPKIFLITKSQKTAGGFMTQ